MKRALWCLALAACTEDAPQIERVQAIDTQQAASLGSAASAPASTPVKTHVEATNKRLCDREYTAKEAPKIALPSPKWKAGAGPMWVNLWAAWCKPCVAEIPELAEWSKEGGFNMLFVSLDDDEREWKQGAAKLGLSDPSRPPLVTSTWLEPGKGRATFLRPLGFLDTPNLPGHALVDRDGRVRCFRAGAVETGEKHAFLQFMKTL